MYILSDKTIKYQKIKYKITSLKHSKITDKNRIHESREITKRDKKCLHKSQISHMRV